MIQTVSFLLGALLTALGGLPLAATPPVPRPSPELRLRDAAGNEIRLSAFKGKVVLVEFLLTNCPHCARIARMINELQPELSARGLRPIGIAFDTGIGGPLVRNFAQKFRIGFPVEYTSSPEVDRYLGRAEAERLQVPQLVLIDRQGVIRAQSQPIGETLLENPAYLHKTIENLLKQSSPSTQTELSSRTWVPSGVSSIVLLTVLAGLLAWMNQRREKHRRLQ